MASLVRRPNGHKWIQFVGADGKRRTLRLGKLNEDHAREIKFHVEHLIVGQGSPWALPAETARWVQRAGGMLRKRLGAAGLIPQHEDLSVATLKALCEYSEKRYLSAKPNTSRNVAMAATKMQEYFGPGRRLDAITPADCDEFREYLRSCKYAESYVTTICKKSRTIFGLAIDKRWLADNPFRRMKGWTDRDNSRHSFVPRAAVERVMSACDPDWQLLIAILRYAGLRCPSELHTLQWSRVNLDAGTMTIFSPKTEKGRAFRDVPIFPELRKHLQDASDRADANERFVVRAAVGKTNSSLRSAFLKRLAKSGVDPWPKLFVNLRSSLETELVEEFPIHVVAYWLGNSPEVAARHYLQVTPEHLDRARVWQPKSEAKKRSSGTRTIGKIKGT